MAEISTQNGSRTTEAEGTFSPTDQAASHDPGNLNKVLFQGNGRDMRLLQELNRRSGSDFNPETGVGTGAVPFSAPPVRAAHSPYAIMRVLEQAAGAQVVDGQRSLNENAIRYQFSQDAFKEMWTTGNRKTEVQKLLRQNPEEAENQETQQFWQLNKFSPEFLGELVRRLTGEHREKYSVEVATAVGQVYGLAREGNLDQAREIIRGMVEGDHYNAFRDCFDEVLGLNYDQWSEDINLKQEDETVAEEGADSMQSMQVDDIYNALFVRGNSAEAVEILVSLNETRCAGLLRDYINANERNLLSDVLSYYGVDHNNEEGRIVGAAQLLRDSIRREDASPFTRWFREIDYDKMALVINSASDEDLIKLASAYKGGQEQLLKDVDKYLPGYYERVRLHKLLRGLDGDDLHQFAAQVGRKSVAASDSVFVNGTVRDANTRRILESRYGKDGQAAADLIAMFRGGGDLARWSVRYYGEDKGINPAKIKELVEYFAEKPIAMVLKNISERNRGSADLDKIERLLVGFDPERSLAIIEQAVGVRPVAMDNPAAGVPTYSPSAVTSQPVFKQAPDRITEMLTDLSLEEKRKLLEVGQDRLQAIINSDPTLQKPGSTQVVEVLTLSLPEQTRAGMLVVIRHVTSDSTLPDSLGLTSSELDQGFRAIFGDSVNLDRWLQGQKAPSDLIRRIRERLED